MPIIVGSLGGQRFSRPVQIAAGRSAAYFDNSPFYGVCSTSSEILQQLRYALGFLEIPKSLAPLMTGFRELSTDLSFQLPHDLIFVEITGRRVLAIDGYILQPSSVGYYFADRPGLAEALTRFWGPDAMDARMRYLVQEPAFDGVSADERRLLTETTADLLGDDDILLDLRRMHALVGDRLVIVTPAVDESNPESVRKTNADMVLALRIAGGQLGLPVFDPTRSLVEFRVEHGFGNSADDAALMAAAFESYLAGVLQREFLGPLRNSGFVSAAAPVLTRETRPDKVRPLAGLGRRLMSALPSRVPRSKPQAAVGAPAEQAPPEKAIALPVEDERAASQRRVRRAAWYGEWGEAAAEAELGLDLAADDPDFYERAATSFWYTDQVDRAVLVWKVRFAVPISPLRRIEAAELAFQACDPGLARAWCWEAADHSPLAAIAAVRLLDAHGQADAIYLLIDRASRKRDTIADMISYLPSGGRMRNLIIEYAVDRGYIDPDLPVVKGIVQQWLTTLALDLRDGRIEAMRAGVARFDRFDPANPARQSARQLLVRALVMKLRDLDLRENPSEVESLASEILKIDPQHVEAAILLARLWDQTERREEAATLLDDVARANPQAAAVQTAAIDQWLAGGDFFRAVEVFRRNRDAGGPSDRVAELKKRLVRQIERDERGARAANDLARADGMRQCLAGLDMMEGAAGSEPRQTAGG